MDFIKELGKYIPTITKYLNKVDIALYDDFKSKYGTEIALVFDVLYLKYNGENLNFPGIFAGFSWMSLSEISSTQNILEEYPGDCKYCTEANMVSELVYSEKWIPFAHDHGGSFLALDFDPGKNGVKGQVISLDRDSEEVCVLANSLDDFCLFVLKSISNGMIEIKNIEGELHFEWKSGHLFNDLHLFQKSNSNNDVSMITLDNYWAKYFSSYCKGNSCVSISELAKLKTVHISAKDLAPNEKINLDVLKFCVNITELICHNDSIESFDVLKDLSKLRKFYVKSKAFNEETLMVLSSCNSLTELGLISLNLRTLETLAGLNLKILSLVNTSVSDSASICKIKTLTELRIESLKADNYNFIGSLKKLKKLELKSIALNNINFLQDMKLTDLTINDIIPSSDWDGVVTDIKTLQNTDWPFAKLNLLCNNTRLKSIGVNAQSANDFESLKGTAIKSITVANAQSEKQAQEIVDKVGEYIELSSYGWQCSWKNKKT